LGAKVYTRLMKPGINNLGADKPSLQETTLGWILFGRSQSNIARQEISQPNQGKTQYQPWKNFGS